MKGVAIPIRAWGRSSTVAIVYSVAAIPVRRGERMPRSRRSRVFGDATAIVRWSDVIVPALLLGPLGLIAGLIWHYWDEITGAIGQLTSWMVEAGAALMHALAAGIRSAAAGPLAAVAEIVAAIASTLSPVSAPLRAIGVAVPGLRSLYPQDGGSAAPTVSGAGERLSAAMSASQERRNASAPLNVDYRPQITLSGSEANKAGVAAALKAGNDDLMDRLQAALEQQQRLAYG